MSLGTISNLLELSKNYRAVIHEQKCFVIVSVLENKENVVL